MNNYLAEPSRSTPAVHFDHASGIMRLSGESYPENPFAFYAPLHAWIEEFLGSGGQPARLVLQLSYINTGTVKCLLDLFDLLEEAGGRGRDVGIRWHYASDNDRALETGREFAEDLTIPFELIAEKA